MVFSWLGTLYSVNFLSNIHLTELLCKHNQSRESNSVGVVFFLNSNKNKNIAYH